MFGIRELVSNNKVRYAYNNSNVSMSPFIEVSPSTGDIRTASLLFIVGEILTDQWKQSLNTKANLKRANAALTFRRSLNNTNCGRFAGVGFDIRVIARSQISK